jgi:hypothetical protein
MEGKGQATTNLEELKREVKALERRYQLIRGRL